VRAEALLVVALGASGALAQSPAPPPPTQAPPPSAAADLGTLFHSSEERARLDKMRRGEPPEPPATKRAPPVVTGFVQRSDGRNTVWIDGRPVPVATPRAAPLFDPRVVRDAPRPVEPPEAKKAEAEPAKPAEGDGARKPEAAPAKKAEPEVKR
jgi:hypothetical protein